MEEDISEQVWTTLFSFQEEDDHVSATYLSKHQEVKAVDSEQVLERFFTYFEEAEEESDEVNYFVLTLRMRRVQSLSARS